MLALRFLVRTSRVRSLISVGSLYSIRAITLVFQIFVVGSVELELASKEYRRDCTIATGRSSMSARSYSRMQRVKLTPHCCSTLGQSIFAEWGLECECSSW